MSSPAPWRRRLSELGRGLGKPHAPLFAPLLYGVAAQIEALAPAEVTADPTRLGKGLVELRRVLQVSHLTVAAPSAMEAEALGAVVDRSAWPPRVIAPAPEGLTDIPEFDAPWSRSEALAASLETCRRLAQTQQGEPVLLAALTGPASLLAELLGARPHTAADFEWAGRALAALARQFAQAGASAILICERELPADASDWSAALGTLGNVARFHRIPALLAVHGAMVPVWPAGMVACPSAPQAAVIDRPHGLCVGREPASWAALLGNTGAARIVVTASEVEAEVSIEELADGCAEALEMERE